MFVMSAEQLGQFIDAVITIGFADMSRKGILYFDIVGGHRPLLQLRSVRRGHETHSSRAFVLFSDFMSGAEFAATAVCEAGESRTDRRNCNRSNGTCRSWPCAECKEPVLARTWI